MNGGAATDLPVLRCRCGREQLAEPAPGGLDERTAIAIGWVRLVDESWCCPLCANAPARDAGGKEVH